MIGEMMRTLFLLILLPSICNAQTEYRCHAFQTMGINVKLDTKITVTDAYVVIVARKGDKYDSVGYNKLVSTIPKILYFTDGVMTETITILEKPGKAKGEEYTHTLILKFDARQGGDTLLYYLLQN